MGSCFLRALAFGIALGAAAAATAQPVRRVPAEFEPQEALWLQWPGRFEKTYEPAFAQISNVVVQYQPLHILTDSTRIRNEARAAITAAGGDPDHPNITWHAIANDNAWMRDNGPVYAVEDGASASRTGTSTPGAAPSATFPTPPTTWCPSPSAPISACLWIPCPSCTSEETWSSTVSTR